MSKIRIAQIGTSRYSHGNFIFDALKKSPDIFGQLFGIAPYFSAFAKKSAIPP